MNEKYVPQISILMAVYNPNYRWLEEQLKSLNGLKYERIKLYIRDDASEEVAYDKLRSLAEKCITAFPYAIFRNEKNLGSNKTFERLTIEAEGDFFAYCDQDDIWIQDKLAILAQELQKEGVKLACSDMYVINSEGDQLADSITKVRHRINLLSGDNLATGLLFRNFVTGCTMIVRSEDAKAAVPFCPYYVHDQYLAIFCADKGRISTVSTPLIKYRIHGNNQTSPLVGVADKRSYQEERIDIINKRLQWLRDNMEMSRSLKKTVDEGLYWANARMKYWDHNGGLATIWKYRRFNRAVVAFEIMARFMPDRLFKTFLVFLKKI